MEEAKRKWEADPLNVIRESMEKAREHYGNADAPTPDDSYFESIGYDEDYEIEYHEYWSHGDVWHDDPDRKRDELRDP